MFANSPGDRGSISSRVILLYIDLRPGQTCHSKDGRSCIFRWPVMGRDCVDKLGWQYGTGLKSHGTVTNWYLGRGWPVNCMTVISARWRSNMPFQRRWKLHIPLPSYGKRVDVKQLYNPGEDRKSGSWRSDELEKKCDRENQHPERLGPQAPGWAAQENGKETRLGPIDWGSICSSSVQPLTPSHT